MADAPPEPKDTKRIAFEFEEEYEAIREQVGNLKEDIRTEDNGAVLGHLVKSYLDPLALDGQERPQVQIEPEAPLDATCTNLTRQ
jgi:hypothetical protein